MVGNRGDGNGGTAAVANAAPDGYTRVLTSSANLTINPNHYAKYVPTPASIWHNGLDLSHHKCHPP